MCCNVFYSDFFVKEKQTIISFFILLLGKNAYCDIQLNLSEPCRQTGRKSDNEGDTTTLFD